MGISGLGGESTQLFCRYQPLAAQKSPRQHQSRWASGPSSSHHVLLFILVTLIEFGRCSPQICPTLHFS